jgi:hypothetical protein
LVTHSPRPAFWEVAIGVGTVVVGFLGDRQYAFARIRWRVGGHEIELDHLVTGVVSPLFLALFAAVLLRGGDSRRGDLQAELGWPSAGTI